MARNSRRYPHAHILFYLLVCLFLLLNTRGEIPAKVIYHVAPLILLFNDNFLAGVGGERKKKKNRKIKNDRHSVLLCKI